MLTPSIGFCGVPLTILGCGRPNHLLDVAGFPALVDGGFCRAEINVDAAVGVLHGLVARTKRRIRPAVGETGSILRLIRCHRPEVGGGDVGRQVNPIVAATRMRRALAVRETDHVFGTLARNLRSHAWTRRVVVGENAQNRPLDSSPAWNPLGLVSCRGLRPALLDSQPSSATKPVSKYRPLLSVSFRGELGEEKGESRSTP